MRLLIDECIDERVRLLFPGYDCQTARLASMGGLRNGLLLEAAEAAGFDVLITVDQNIPEQQNLAGRNIAIVILYGQTNRLRDLVPLVAISLSALRSIRPGDVVKTGSSSRCADGTSTRWAFPAHVGAAKVNAARRFAQYPRAGSQPGQFQTADSPSQRRILAGGLAWPFTARVNRAKSPRFNAVHLKH